jgi:hypothetical protein
MGMFSEKAIVDYRFRLPTKENKLLFSVFVYSKQTEVCHFLFPFAANIQKLPFSATSIFCTFTYIYATISNGNGSPGYFLNPFTV